MSLYLFSIFHKSKDNDRSMATLTWSDEETCFFLKNSDMYPQTFSFICKNILKTKRKTILS